MAAERQCALSLLLAVVCFICVCCVRGQPVITISEMSAIECGPSLDFNSTCVQCAPVSNISLPASFFTADVKCTRVQNFADNSLAYMSEANSASLSFFNVPESGPADCSGSEFLFSVNIPSSSRCGSAPVQSIRYTIKSSFDQYGGEQSYVMSSAWVSCGRWLNYGSPYSSCPLAFLANTTAFCGPPAAGSYNIFTSAVSFNLTVYNECLATCNTQYNSLCTSSTAQCQSIADTYLGVDQARYSQTKCGCYEAQYACQYASGCYPGGVGLEGLLNNVNLFCAGTSNAVFTCANTSSSSTTTTTTTPAPSTISSSGVTVSCSSSDFGGSFGGAIFGTFIMHAITGLAIYARKRMTAQGVTVSNKAVNAEEAAMVSKD